MRKILGFIGLTTLVGCASGASSTGAVTTDYIPSLLAVAGVASAIYAVVKYNVGDLAKAKWYGAVAVISAVAGILFHIAS